MHSICFQSNKKASFAGVKRTKGKEVRYEITEVAKGQFCSSWRSLYFIPISRKSLEGV